MLIFDSHSHYDDKKFDGDRDAVLSGLKEKGVGFILSAGCTIKSSIAASKLAGKYDFVFASAGVHPIDCVFEQENYLQEIQEIVSSNKKIVAIGEIGLDYHYDTSPKELQKKFFEEQLILANKLNMPVIVHIREATADALKILKQYKPKGVVHCFSGSVETAREILDLGMYIGFTGVITFNNAKKACTAAEFVPLDRLLIETDCPYMAPVPFRGSRCDSSMLNQTAEKLAEIKGVSKQQIIDITTENAIKAYEMEGLI